MICRPADNQKILSSGRAGKTGLIKSVNRTIRTLRVSILGLMEWSVRQFPDATVNAVVGFNPWFNGMVC